jgi:hypothetical protein
MSLGWFRSLVEKDIEQDLDPQMAQIDDRLSRIEALLKNLQPRALPDSNESETTTKSTPRTGTAERPATTAAVTES